MLNGIVSDVAIQYVLLFRTKLSIYLPNTADLIAVLPDRPFRAITSQLVSAALYNKNRDINRRLCGVLHDTAESDKYYFMTSDFTLKR